MRAVRAGTIQEAVQDAYRAAGKLEEVAGAIGIAPATLSFATQINEDRPGGLGVNYLDRMARMYPAAAAEIAAHFAALAGGVYQPVISTTASIDLGEHAFAVAKEGGEATSAAIRAALTGSLRDCETALREIDESIEAQTLARASLLTRAEQLRNVATLPLRGAR